MTDTATVEPGETGLLDNVQVTDDTKTADNSQKVEIDHKTTPAGAAEPDDPLERPDFWPENFWKKDSNEPDLEGIAKSWSDLRKMISQGKHKAPEGGKYDTATLGEGPVAGALTEFAAKWGLPQAAFDELAQRTMAIAEESAGPAIDTKAEIKALGPNGQAVINGMVDWARGLVNKGVWGKDDFEEFKIMGGTAKGMRALLKIREAYEGRVPIDSAPIEGAPSKEELYQMVNDPKYKTDAGYRQKVERMFQQFVQ